MRTIAITICCFFGGVAMAQTTVTASLDKNASAPANQGSPPPATGQGVTLSEKRVPATPVSEPILPADTTGQVSSMKRSQGQVNPQKQNQQ